MDQAMYRYLLLLSKWGGKTYAVYNPENEKEFAQTCDLVERARVHNNGPADYRKKFTDFYLDEAKDERNSANNG